jgi:membrane protein implicated in regulation of membrane protease activity
MLVNTKKAGLNRSKGVHMMATYLLWAIAGFVLIIAELLSGTFYLLVLGLAALAAAGVAFASGDFWVQAMVAAGVSLIGIYLVRRWWTNHPDDSAASNNLDLGQAVVVESWVDQTAGVARVKYRGSTWEAKLEANPEHPAKLTDVLYIRGQENGVFQVGAKPL